MKITKGTRMVRKNRTQCNKLSNEERKGLTDRMIKIIYSSPPRKDEPYTVDKLLKDLKEWKCPKCGLMNPFRYINCDNGCRLDNVE